MIKKDTEYISLKEAAQLSGYSADYIGQLIRSGKISGKQVFSNVAWVTTKEAIAEYLQKDKKSDDIPKTKWERIVDVLTDMETLQKIYAAFVWFFLALLGCFALILLYVLAVSIDHKIEERHLQKTQYERS